MKRLLAFIFIFMVCGLSHADQFTTNYNLCIPSEGSRDWISKISADIVSIDEAIKNVSNDSAFTGSTGIVTVKSGVTEIVVPILSVDSILIISTEQTVTVGGQVARIMILSSDGVTKCYIPVYAGS